MMSTKWRWYVIGMATLLVAFTALIGVLKHTAQSKPNWEAVQLLTFITQHMMSEEGGIYTNLRNDHQQQTEHEASNHQMLSESTGLMMRYALYSGQEELFAQQYRFLNKRLLDELGYVRWRYEPGKEPASVNATIDDLRIAALLLIAGEQWNQAEYTATGKRITLTLYEANVVNDRLYDFYDAATDTRAAQITMSYLNLADLSILAKHDPRWNTVIQQSVQLLQDAKLPNGLFRKAYNSQNNQWTSGNINMIDTLYTAYHAAQYGIDVSRTVAFVEQEWNARQRLYSEYDINGQPTTSTESPAVYALAIRLLNEANAPTTIENMRNRMLVWSVRDPHSPYYGGFVQEHNGSAYSFDQLQPLVMEAERKL